MQCSPSERPPVGAGESPGVSIDILCDCMGSMAGGEIGCVSLLFASFFPPPRSFWGDSHVFMSSNLKGRLSRADSRGRLTDGSSTL
jgi:hypothetical protein